MPKHGEVRGHCERWIPTPGVMGQLEFMGRHRDGDCTPKPPKEGKV